MLPDHLGTYISRRQYGRSGSEFPRLEHRCHLSSQTKLRPSSQPHPLRPPKARTGICGTPPRPEERTGEVPERYASSNRGSLDAQNTFSQLKKIGGEGRDSNPPDGVNHHSPEESGPFALPTATSPRKPQ